MKEIVKVLLAEGIDEETIHEVLDVIEENYEIVNEFEDDVINALISKRKKGVNAAEKEAEKLGLLQFGRAHGALSKKQEKAMKNVHDARARLHKTGKLVKSYKERHQDGNKDN